MKSLKAKSGVIPKFIRPSESRLTKQVREKNNQPSKTVPNQSMTITEMVARYRKGLPIYGSSKTPIYSGESTLRDLTTMDLVDRQAYIDSVADHLVEVRARLDQNAKTVEEKKFLAAVDKEVRDRITKMHSDAAAEAKKSKDEKPPF